MQYTDKDTGEVKTRIPIEVQVKRVEDMLTMYHEHLLNMAHRNFITGEYREQAEREADAVVDTMRWVREHVEIIKEVVALEREGD